MNDRHRQVELTVNGEQRRVPDTGQTLLMALRDDLGLTSVKDGCSPQGQCGCCTVLVDGSPRVSCVTPLRRVKGRSVTTSEGLDKGRREAWGAALCATGGSQCGFCTPGIVMRLEAALDGVAPEEVKPAVDQALLAHLCRCTGWQTITEAAELVVTKGAIDVPSAEQQAARSAQAEIEGGSPQILTPDSALGGLEFAADSAPADSLVAVQNSEGEWVLGESLSEARSRAAKVQGRRTTVAIDWPLEVPEGDWAHTIRTTWTEPSYLETDASWCAPGGEPASIDANGGAFGAKADSPVMAAAVELSTLYQRPVLALASREDVTRWGAKRPPVAGGIASDGTGLMAVVATPGVAEIMRAQNPLIEIVEVDVAGPKTGSSLRGAGWAEVAVLTAALTPGEWISSPGGASAKAEISVDEIRVSVRCGEVKDATVARSYCVGAAHMAWSWLHSESLSVVDGEVNDLTIRSFGILRAVDMPKVIVDFVAESGPAVSGSEAVFAAVAAAGWIHKGCSQDWPLGATL